jgi:hypothetical protein
MPDVLAVVPVLRAVRLMMQHGPEELRRSLFVRGKPEDHKAVDVTARQCGRGGLDALGVLLGAAEDVAGSADSKRARCGKSPGRPQ